MTFQQPVFQSFDASAICIPDQLTFQHFVFHVNLKFWDVTPCGSHSIPSQRALVASYS
jgi:hypothetical protein